MEHPYYFFDDCEVGCVDLHPQVEGLHQITPHFLPRHTRNVGERFSQNLLGNQAGQLGLGTPTSWACDWAEEGSVASVGGAPLGAEDD